MSGTDNRHHPQRGRLYGRRTTINAFCSAREKTDVAIHELRIGCPMFRACRYGMRMDCANRICHSGAAVIVVQSTSNVRPDISGYSDQSGGSSDTYHPSGVFSARTLIQDADIASRSQQGRSIVSIDFTASKGNAIFGNSHTLQAASLRLLPVIRPDITGVTTGAFIRNGSQNSVPAGAFSYIESYDAKVQGYSHGYWASPISFDARRANSAYSRERVQPSAIRLAAIIKS